MVRMGMFTRVNSVSGRSWVESFLVRASMKAMRLPIAGTGVKNLLFNNSMLPRTYLPRIMQSALSFSGGIASGTMMLPEMEDIPGMPGKRIMTEEVTVGLFKQVMKGYKIEGHNADILQSILADPARDSHPLTYINLLDARELAARLSKLTGRKFRVQTKDEWLAAGTMLRGINWTWTETKHDDQYFSLCNIGQCNLAANKPETRYLTGAARLVEDL